MSLKKIATPPKFYQAILQEVKGNVLEYVYPQLKGGRYMPTMTERMGDENATCPECSKNEWMILAKETASVREGGKSYIECINCGYFTHL